MASTSQPSSSNAHPPHWMDGTRVLQCTIVATQNTSTGNDKAIPFDVVLSAEDGYFPVCGPIATKKYAKFELSDGTSSNLVAQCILLEIDERKICGMTKESIRQHIFESAADGDLTVKFVLPNFLSSDLRKHLSLSFPKGSVDDELQRTIRENVYKKTVPFTTRAKRPEEVNGREYRFVSVNQFNELERNGELLESGVYKDNLYGTQKPSSSAEASPYIVPGVDPRSTVNHAPPQRSTSGVDYHLRRRTMPPVGYGDDNGNNAEAMTVMPQMNNSDALGSLPSNWEIAYTEYGEKYFIDHNTGSTHWHDPRLGPINGGNAPTRYGGMGSTGNSVGTDSDDGAALPPGWERICDPQYGVFYMDHINKVTQYERPSLNEHDFSGGNGYNDTSNAMGRRPNGNTGTATRRRRNVHEDMFTTDPSRLEGEIIKTTLVKGQRGLGFTLIGNDSSSSSNEFLQIKSILPAGPAHEDDKLRMGDILVYIGANCVLGASQDDAIHLFQNIQIGESVPLTACRGYPLLFDPHGDIRTLDMRQMTVKEGGGSRPHQSIVHHLNIVKSGEGFGFTIADSMHGQRIKKVLCPGLQDGDTFVEINGVPVSNMSHTQLVDVLRECAVGEMASIVVRRENRSSSNLPSYASTRAPPPVAGKPRNRPHSTYAGEQPPGNGTNDRQRSRTPTEIANGNGGQYRPQMNNGPLIKPRSKTPTSGALPPRPDRSSAHATSNGHLPLQHRQQQMIDPSTGQAIYENYAQRQSRSGATPNYIPASVYQQRGTTPLPTTTGSYAGYETVTVNLLRQPAGFGFRLVGGTEEGTPIHVGHITPNGAAALDNRLRCNDEIVEIDTISVFNGRHDHAVQLMTRAADGGRVKLVVRRPLREIAMPRSASMPPIHHEKPSVDYNSQPMHTSHYEPSTSHANNMPYDVNLGRHEDEGFGFVIISSVAKNGSTIGRLMEGSPAARCEQLRMNDRIVAVNGMDITRMHHSDIVNLIKDSGLTVTLTIAPPGYMNDSSPHNSLSYTGNPTASHVIDRHLARVADEFDYGVDDYAELSTKGWGDISVSDPPTPPDEKLVTTSSQSRTTIVKPFEPNPDYSYEEATAGKTYNDSGASINDVFTVSLSRGGKGFGFSIRGGREFGRMPLFVLKIADGGPADEDGRLRVGDQLVDINGVDTTDMTHEYAIQLIRQTQNVTLTLRRLPQQQQQLQQSFQ